LVARPRTNLPKTEPISLRLALILKLTISEPGSVSIFCRAAFSLSRATSAGNSKHGQSFRTTTTLSLVLRTIQEMQPASPKCWAYFTLAPLAGSIDWTTHQIVRVWHNFWDTKLTYEKSYLARLNYVHQNAVKHGLVPVANQYRWCSARWFEGVASSAMVRSIYRFKTNALTVKDDYAPIVE
jgi:hypothetical protein